MKSLLLFFGILLSFNQVFAGSMELETPCGPLEYIFENINERLPEDRQFTLECKDSSKSKLWGAIKYDFKADINLSNELELCEDAKYSYRKIHHFDSGAHIGISLQNVEALYEIMNKHSVSIEVGATGSAVGTIYAVTSVQFPACGD